MQARLAVQQSELDQILAPIALYPDALLSQILMAATYPDRVSSLIIVNGTARLAAADGTLADAQVFRALDAFNPLFAQRLDPCPDALGQPHP